MGNYKRICVRVNDGSGTLFKSKNPEYDYVITSKHCLQEDEKNLAIEKIEVWTNKNNEKIHFEVLDCPINSEIRDISIIKVKPIKGYGIKNLFIGLNQGLEIKGLKIYGFPENARDKGDLEMELESFKIHSFEVISDSCKIKIGTEDLFKDLDKIDKNTSGYSGSGVFKEVKNNIFYYGLFDSVPIGRSYGRIMSSNDIVRLFDDNDLIKPQMADSEFLIECSKVIEEFKKIVEASGALEKELYKENLENLNDYIVSNYITVKELWDKTFPSLKDINIEIVEDFILFFFLVLSKEKKLELEDKEFSILVNENKNWLFKSENFKYGERTILAELSYRLNKEYRGKKGILNIFDIVLNKETPGFNCVECGMKSKLLPIDQHLQSFLDTQQKNYDFITLKKRSDDLKLECGDCFKITKIQKGMEKLEFYNLKKE